MHIEELVIDGFKSYSTRVNVGLFDRQFNAITGLNGSGKSNILDSICFVLGISNLSQVRVGNLSELVYKQGQAGVTKASVTVVFNNEDKSRSPVGYEEHDKITITRQIVIGGRNRYLLNSHNVQQNQIQNLFHSVSLNVNNPHFLIMQGRITKVINMKPQETLGMIEEAAGTRMYENKKAGALKTLEKKQNKVDEINRLLSEEITPTLEKLQKERANYMLWVSNNNEIERLSRFCVAFEYTQVLHKLENKNQQLEELENAVRQLVVDLKTLEVRDKQITKEIKDRASLRDSQSGKELKKLEDEHSKLSKEVAQTESKLGNKEGDLKAELESQKKGKNIMSDLQKQVDAKEKVAKKEQQEWEALATAEAAVRKEIEKAQWNMQAAVAGVSAQQEGSGEGVGKSMREELLEAQTRLWEFDADQKKKAMTIKSLQDKIANTTKVMSDSKQESKRLAKEKATTEAMVQEKRAALGKMKFDSERFQALRSTFQESERSYLKVQERLDQLRSQLGGVDFSYTDPHKNFDRSKVKGVVSKLFHIKPAFQAYHRALEVCAGGRLFFVVVDNEETGKALLEKGQLKRRVTIIPLNKIVDHCIKDGVVRQAKSVMPQGGDLHLAMEIVGFDKDVQSAMKFVFGGFLVCDTPETAKQVTFHPNVRVRSVTKDGDLYDPAGTITGGSAPRGGNLLMRLQELADCEKQVHSQRQEYEQINLEMRKMQAASEKYFSVERDLQCKDHELKLIEERISRSEHFGAEQSLQEMKTQLSEAEADLKGMPEEKKRLEKLVKQLDKDIKSLDSSREDRIKVCENQVERLKGQLKDQEKKLLKQREKTEQANVELEVARNELKEQEGKEELAGQNNDGLKADIEKLKDTLEKKKAYHADLGARLDRTRTEMQKLDQVLQDLSIEQKTNKQSREEKEIEQKRAKHKLEQLQKDDKESTVIVARMEKEYPWIEKEKAFFGKKGTDFDFHANSYQENKGRLEELGAQQKNLSKNINKKAMVMFEKAEQEYKDLLQKRDIILNDKKKIRVCDSWTWTKRSWRRCGAHGEGQQGFQLHLWGFAAKCERKIGAAGRHGPTEGLEIKVGFHGVWKQSLTELSGGQRSLMALSLVLALLLFKPAPMYILDEIDSALDLSHTQNIGHMIRTHFPHSQFIVVSLKEGMFNHANVLFRTRFIDGTSQVTRYAIRDGDAPPEDKENQNDGAKAKRRKVLG
uniref:Structural maintenance of chromosomes protein n=1 Tax=Crypthecodinium cohnii TaxID=2866 RepID=A0A075C4H4_CRYCO|nr:structure maintenance of chromosomes 2 [Crypthecodinium cohnii]